MRHSEYFVNLSAFLLDNAYHVLVKESYQTPLKVWTIFSSSDTGTAGDSR